MRFFKKVCQPSAKLSYTVTDRDVSNWDVAAKRWKVTPGTYTVHVGASSQDIRLSGTMAVRGE